MAYIACLRRVRVGGFVKVYICIYNFLAKAVLRLK
jgi:hypothetical protein